MNVKEFMETQKNSNEIEKEEAATALNFKHVQLLQPLFWALQNWMRCQEIDFQIT